MKKKKCRFLFILLFVILLPIILLELLFKAILRLIKKVFKRTNKFTDKEFYQNLSIEKVDIMDGVVFEQFLKRLFIYKGYQVCETSRTGDYGADLILKNDGLTTVVQAKRYNANVGARAIQEVYSARHHYHADRMMVVTNTHFTRQAELMAEEQDVTLVDREELVAVINEVKLIIEESLNERDKLDNEETDGSRGLSNFKYRI